VFSAPDDTVADPFAGRGVTAVAALRLGRTFIGVDIDPGACAVARRRLEGGRGADPGLGVTHGGQKGQQPELLLHFRPRET
jgi:DNA modification methylase